MVKQKANLQQKEAAPKRAEKTRIAATKCAAEKKFRDLCRRKSIDVYLFKGQNTVEQLTVELMTFRPEVSSAKRNDRQFLKAQEYMKKKS